MDFIELTAVLSVSEAHNSGIFMIIFAVLLVFTNVDWYKNDTLLVFLFDYDSVTALHPISKHHQ